MSTGLQLASRDGIRAVAVQAKQFQTEIAKCEDRYEKGLLIAEAMNALRTSMTETVVAPLVALQGSGLGFRTDKDKDGGYGWETVRDCTIEAWLRGFYHVGNEFNVISGRFYGAKAGFERLVRTYPGVTNLQLHVGNPEIVSGTAFVAAVAAWNLDGKEDVLELVKHKLASGGELDERIAVRINAGMGHDAILGKAYRKLYAAIYTRLTGATDIIPEGDVDDVGGAPAAPQKKLQRSSLFDDAPPEPADPFPASNDALENYDIRITEAKSRADIQAIAKEIAADKRLSKEDRGQAMAWVNKKLAGAGR